jgi:hypothetical protein
VKKFFSKITRFNIADKLAHVGKKGGVVLPTRGEPNTEDLEMSVEAGPVVDGLQPIRLVANNKATKGTRQSVKNKQGPTGQPPVVYYSTMAPDQAEESERVMAELRKHHGLKPE